MHTSQIIYNSYIKKDRLAEQYTKKMDANLDKRLFEYIKFNIKFLPIDSLLGCQVSFKNWNVQVN